MPKKPVHNLDISAISDSWNIGTELQKNQPIRTTNANLKYLFDNSDEKLTKLNLTEFIKTSEAEGYIYKLKSLSSSGQRTMNSTNNFMVVTQGWNSLYNFLPRTLESSMVTNSLENINMYLKENLVKSDILTNIDSQAFELNDVENNLLKKGKADFALQSLDIISDRNFKTPTYLLEGLKWLVN